MRERALPVADERQPRRIGPRGGRGEDLDVVAVLELGAQRHELVVDPRRDAVVADVGVHGVAEIDRRRAARQRHDLALRREHVDLVGEEVALDVLEELLRVARFRLDLEQALQPAVRLALRLREVELAGGLVQPVRGDARLGDPVHVVRADLRLERRAERAEQRRVQRLVAVGLRDRDVVLELARDGLVEAVQRAQRRVAGRRVRRPARARRRCRTPARTCSASRPSSCRPSRSSSRAPRRRRVMPALAKPSRITSSRRFITSRRLPRAALMALARMRKRIG